MMIRWRRLFLHDMGRKGLALCLAVFVWGEVNKKIGEESWHGFTVVTVPTDSPAVPRNMSIQVVIPEGWILLEPKPDEQVHLHFDGPESSINSYLERQCAASFVPAFSDELGAEPTFTVSPRDLNWLNQEESDRFLLNEVGGQKDSDETQLSFRFAREIKEPVPLIPQYVETAGVLPDGYTLDRGGITFSPSQVTIRGPEIEIAEFAKALDAFDPEAGTPPTLLDPVTLGRSTREFESIVGIADALSDRGLVMEPETVSVTLPVLVQARVQFRPRTPELLGSAADGSQWEVVWLDRQWEATMSQAPGQLPFDKEFAEEKIFFFAYLDDLPADPPREFDLPLQWTVKGKDPEIRKKMNALLKLRQPTGEDLTVTVRRVELPAGEDSGNTNGNGVEDDE